MLYPRLLIAEIYCMAYRNQADLDKIRIKEVVELPSLLGLWNTQMD